MNKPMLVTMRKVTGQIRVLTGLRIGGSQETMEISGLDNPLIRNPGNAEPYIPGSSLKGRMRSLAEWYFGEVPLNGEVTRPMVTKSVAKVFGVPAADPSKAPPSERAAYQRGPTRLIVRDAPLSQESRDRYKAGQPITEVKSENSINRLTSMANPRPMERVLPNVAFDLEMVYRVFDIDGDAGNEDETLFDQVVLMALALVEADALGGGSSRGSGKVRFEQLRVDAQPRALPPLVSPTARQAAG